MPLPSEDPIVLVSEKGLGTPELTPKHASWLLSGMFLMGLDSYFPRVSSVSSLWTPLQAAIPVLHWMVSWWILPPGWEPNLVSLAPSLTAGRPGINSDWLQSPILVMWKGAKGTPISGGELINPSETKDSLLLLSGMDKTLFLTLPPSKESSPQD
ncbi:hypothetical protein DSO57_1015362 [Entomophthora muscae]|uniref:Uncharacterized protein n=1 Tax=Entomophthora muscae TaxID=34485 RepID=A0ACC2S791_9FUNG|nr:hypothetical protein DSO57_1015362 [Entomophthora muscae]